MFWSKAWRDTRWPFWIGVALMIATTCVAILSYPRAMALTSQLSAADLKKITGEDIGDLLDLTKTYRGYVWSQTFRLNLAQLAVLFGALLGASGPFARGDKGRSIFLLSMPISREKLLRVWALTGLAELLVLSLVPALLIVPLSPLVGESYAVSDVLLHGLFLFVGASVWLGLSFLFSAAWPEFRRPWLLTCAVAFVLAQCFHFAPGLAAFDPFRILSAESHLRSGSIPWLGLLLMMGVTWSLLFGAERLTTTTDF